MQGDSRRCLNVVCLLSGGKDSVYHLHRVHSQGHNIVALATLTPTPPFSPSTSSLLSTLSSASGDGERVVAPVELDSWLYQSVGTEMMSGVARALARWPLYVFHLPPSTRARRTSLYYEETCDDEVEHLVTLLTRVKSDFPTLDAVASGAILSHYQRLRIEHVCARLGLLSLAYLWEQDQSALLDEMLHEGICAVLVKTACVGLDARHVGHTLNELQSHLLRLHQLYDVNVCGEGGEYESLTLDAPLYQARIVLDETSVHQHAPDVYLLRIHRFHLQVKPPHTGLPPSPPVVHVLPAESPSLSPSPRLLNNLCPVPLPPLPLHLRNGFFHLSGASSLDGDSVEQSAQQLFTRLQQSLQYRGYTMAHLFFVFVVLSEMKDFEVLNKVYKTFFGVNPPSRACVAVRTTTRVRAEVWGVCPVREATIPMTSEEWGAIRHGLHVQSLSEWAPACIGPYSQAQGIDLPNDAGRLWWLAGQIGLQPSTLTLAAPHDPIAQLHLTLRHITRILDSTTQHRLHLVSLLHGVLYFVPSLLSPTLLCEHLPLDWKMRLLCVAVSELPRHAAVEVQMLAHETTASVASSNIKHLSFIENVRLMDESDFATLCRITYSFDNFVIATLICYGPSPLVTSVPFDRLVLCALTHLATQLYHCHSIESLASPSQFWSHCLNVRLWYHPALVTTSEEFDLAMQRIQLQETSLPPLVAYPSQWTHLFAENTSNPSLPPSHVPYVTVCCEMYRYG